MTETQLATLGISSGVINLIATIPYIRDILRGNTKPERATYWIWFILSFVGFFAQLAGGARWSLLLSLSSTIAGGVTAVLSLKYGYGRFHRRDGIALIVTGIGVITSLIYQSPLVAVATVVLIQVIAAGLTLYKTWYAPYTENYLAWRISSVGTLCGVLAVGEYHPAIFLSPLANFMINILMVIIIFTRRPRVIHQPADI